MDLLGKQFLKIEKAIKLDIGCGRAKPEGWTGLDWQDLPGVDIRWDFNLIPWPIEAETVAEARAHHVIEHIPRVQIEHWYAYHVPGNHVTIHPFINFMNEVWRVMMPGGLFYIWYPPGGSMSYYQDPTHVNPCSYVTWEYFDPEANDGFFYKCYEPKPWKIVTRTMDNIENHIVVLLKHDNKPSP